MKTRNGFITFWLWFMIIANLFSAILLIRNFVASFDFLFGDFKILTIISVISGVFGSLCYIISAAKLLNWKKSGFRLMMVVAIILMGVNTAVFFLLDKAASDAGIGGVSFGPNTLYTIAGGILSLIVLRAILGIKKDGVSCWSQLE